MTGKDKKDWEKYQKIDRGRETAVVNAAQAAFSLFMVLLIIASILIALN